MTLFGVVFRLCIFMMKHGAYLALGGIICLMFYTIIYLPDVSHLVDQNPETTSFMQRYQAGSGGRLLHTWVPLEEVSIDFFAALLVGEDDRFFNHKGFDFTEILISFEKNMDKGKIVRGGSTLSQQLVKNLYLSPDRTFGRKFNEVLLTWKMEHSLTKQRILELYVNLVDFGKGCFGVGVAAEVFYKKKPSELTLDEAAGLVARLPSPSRFTQNESAEYLRQRTRWIASQVKRRGRSSDELRKNLQGHSAVVVSVRQSSPRKPTATVPTKHTLIPAVTGEEGATSFTGMVVTDLINKTTAGIQQGINSVITQTIGSFESTPISNPSGGAAQAGTLFPVNTQPKLSNESKTVPVDKQLQTPFEKQISTIQDETGPPHQDKPGGLPEKSASTKIKNSSETSSIVKSEKPPTQVDTKKMEPDKPDQALPTPPVKDAQSLSREERRAKLRQSIKRLDTLLAE